VMQTTWSSADSYRIGIGREVTETAPAPNPSPDGDHSGHH